MTKALLVMLLIVAGYAAWIWFRPYDWRPDPGARFRVEGVQVTRDHANHWLDVHLRRSGAAEHDLLKPVRLVLAGGRELEPADTTLVGTDGKGTTEIWYRFWLEPGDLDCPMQLRMNDGILRVKAGGGVPSLGISGRKVFNSTDW